MRNLGLIISFWLSAILIPTNSLALGLGEIEVNSFLNQPLKAEIKVISARAGEIDDLLVSLASRDAFTRAGLSRPKGLSELRFAVRKSEEGDSAVILVTTNASVKEPFLNFLVEADWSKGRLLREFTILLDPPFFADSPATTPAAEPEAVATQSTTESVQAEPKPEASTPIVESEAYDSGSTSEQQTITEPIAFSDEDQNTKQSDIGQVASSADVVVEKGNTLWSIASNLQNSGFSMSQIMLAVQRANPDAFGDDNINNLKVGSVLRMPDASEMSELDQQQAYARVLEQNGLWDDYVARVTGEPAFASESESRGPTDTKDDTQQQTAELNLLTPGDGESDAAGLQNEGDDANELRVKLALAEEELDASRIENQELDSRIAELEARLSKFEELQKMVEIEDDSLAKIQENQAQENESIISNDALSEEQKSADEDALLEELLTVDETVTAESSDAMVEDAATEVETPAVKDSDILTEGDSLESDQSSEAPPVPVIVTEPLPTEPSILDSILPAGILDMLPDFSRVMPSVDALALDPVMLGGLGGILLLLIGLLIYKRMKSTNDDDDVVVNDPIFAADGREEEDDLTPIHLAEGAFDGLEDDTDINLSDDASVPSSMFEENVEDGFSETAVISDEDMSAAEAPAIEEQDDILNEADVYLAYNLYDNAEELLASSLDANPERADYRSKLLDTHFATKNVEAFIREAESLKSMGSPSARYWDRVAVMGFELAPDNALFADAKESGMSAADLEFSKPAAADFDLGADEDETNFSTTDFDLGEDDTGSFESTDYSSAEFGEDTDAPQAEQIDDDSTELPALDEAESTVDEIGDLDFAFDESEAVDPEDSSEDLDFGLPDDLDLSSDELDVETTSVIEAGTAVIDTDTFSAELDIDNDLQVESTTVLDSAAIPEAGDNTDFGMDDTATMHAAIDGSTDDIDDVILDLGDIDDDDSLSMDVDMAADNLRTDTFAPGDFDDPEELAAIEADISSAGIDDIEDLMLPDDVDEVSTKLDLARAFIDMGDAEGARSSLDEVLVEGNDEQKAEAQALIDQL